MNCNTFRSKLPQYMENDMGEDILTAMKKHMEECAGCRNLYEEEKYIDDIFFDTLKLKEIEFNSSRSSIIKGIDKNRYGKSPLKKLKYNIRRFKLHIMSSAAVIAVIIVTIPYLTGNIFGHTSPKYAQNNSLYDTAIMGAPSKMAEDASKVAKYSISSDSSLDNGIADAAETPKSEELYVPQFEKVTVSSSYITIPKAATTWQSSPDTKMEACLYGRGESARDEGIADIVFLNKKDSTMWKLSLINNDKKRFTPMLVRWFDNSNILITMGLGDGHATYGGDLFLVNVYTGKTLNLLPIHSNKKNEEAVDVYRESDSLKVTVRVFDDAHNLFNDEIRQIYFSEVYSQENRVEKFKTTVTAGDNDAINKVVAGLTEAVKDKSRNKLKALLDSKLMKDNPVIYSELSGIESISINRVIDMSKPIENNEEKSKLYYTEVECKAAQEGKIIKSGVNFLAFNLEKDENNNWVITKVTRLPQN